MDLVWFFTGVALIVYVVRFLISGDDKILATVINIYIGWVVVNFCMLLWQLGSSQGNLADKKQVYPFDTNNIAAYSLGELVWYIAIPAAVVMFWSRMIYPKR